VHNLTGRLLCQMVMVGFLFSCKSNTKPFIAPSGIDTLNAPMDSTTAYFPTSTHSRNEIEFGKRLSDSLTKRWYSYHLYALKEPVIKDYKGSNEIYRFTWLRSFDHPITIRLQNHGVGIQLFAKMTSGAGGYESGKITWDTTFTISKNQWNDFIALADKARFWQMPIDAYRNGKDGAEWIMEGVRDKQYHWVNRWSPADTDNFKSTCEYLLKLSKVRLNSKRFY